MNRLLKFHLFTTVPVMVALTGCGHFAHVPPGQSVNVALAKTPELIRLPETSAPSAYASAETAADEGLSVEPDLPAMDLNDVPTQEIVATDVATYVSKGDGLLHEGKIGEAIQAYQNAVDLDPTFSVAWRNLALAYQDAGDDTKAKDAYRRYKAYAAQ
jgi:tetratricopeptide (TPR) repeat protein